MKGFHNYQWVPGVPKTERDKKEEGSKFWNEGKWENYVLPFLEGDFGEMTFVDDGCNAGIFLREAKNLGFREVVGIEPTKEAFIRAYEYRERINGDYELHRWLMEESFPRLPVADYTVLANVHYYLSVEDWLDWIDEAKNKTRYCIVVTADKRRNRYRPLADVESLKKYFREWELVGLIDDVPMEGDPFPRKLYGLCFKSPNLERELLEKIPNRNKMQKNFYAEIDKGREVKDTQYFRKLFEYRKGKWSREKVLGHCKNKKDLYLDIKENGMKRPVIINERNKTVDGNHRHRIMEHLGYKTIITRRVP